MRYLGSLFLFFVTLDCTVAQATLDAHLKAAGSRLQVLVNETNETNLQWFAPDFFHSVPQTKLIEGLKLNRQLLGTVKRVRLCKLIDPWTGEVELIGENNHRMKVSIQLEKKDPYRFIHVLFATLDRGDDTWEILENDIRKLPGRCAVTVSELVPLPKTIYALNSNESLAVGSSFKLLILNLLAEEISTGKRRWSDIVHLRTEGRSLPSGLLQDWPIGSPVTLHTLATMMIARSDNTAADHLILTLGREALEEHQWKIKISEPARNRPLLRTSELFKLKLVLSHDEAGKYLRMSEIEKRNYLPELGKRSLASPRWPITPQSIEQIEWFFSTNDLVRIMSQLSLAQEKTAILPLLSITRPFDMDDDAWKYLGFKGGAEVGVLNLSLLGQLKSNAKWYGISFTWNDPQQAIQETVWIRMAERSLRLIERGIEIKK